MIVPGYKKYVTPSSDVPMSKIVDHIDHICQLAGNANHCGIGTDLDGGYGREQSPGDLDTIATSFGCRRHSSSADIPRTISRRSSTGTLSSSSCVAEVGERKPDFGQPRCLGTSDSRHSDQIQSDPTTARQVKGQFN